MLGAVQIKDKHVYKGVIILAIYKKQAEKNILTSSNFSLILHNEAMQVVATKGKSISPLCSGIRKYNFANSRMLNIVRASFHFQTFFRQVSVK